MQAVARIGGDDHGRLAGFVYRADCSTFAFCIHAIRLLSAVLTALCTYSWHLSSVTVPLLLYLRNDAQGYTRLTCPCLVAMLCSVLPYGCTARRLMVHLPYAAFLTHELCSL